MKTKQLILPKHTQVIRQFSIDFIIGSWDRRARIHTINWHIHSTAMQGRGLLSTDSLALSLPPNLTCWFLLFKTSKSFPLLNFLLAFCFVSYPFCQPFPPMCFHSPRAPAPYTTYRESSESHICAGYLWKYHMENGSNQFWCDFLCPRLFFWAFCVHKSIHGLGLSWFHLVHS